MNARLQFLADVGAIVRGCTLPAPVLTPVPRRLTCPTCDGLERVETGQAADGCIHDKPCPNAKCELGTVPNEDWEPGLCTCPCGKALLPTDSCRDCGAEYTGETA